jgi:aspartyl-tRNA(Asn)/glutamyl-tRNA(Gln) amidotransferase subunit C
MSEDSRTDAVDPETVDHVASLARIDLDAAERERFAEQFAAILEHFETLDEVPEVDAEPDLVNVLREDEVRESLPRSAALANAAETEDGKFKGPNVS